MNTKLRKTIMRSEIQQRLAKAIAAAENPATVFCIQPFTVVEHDGGEQLGRLLARVMGDPGHALLVATEDAFVFAFEDQLDQNKGNRLQDNEAAEPQAARL
jgi:ABC-type lipoprotein export system ATPase subunit